MKNLSCPSLIGILAIGLAIPASAQPTRVDRDLIASLTKEVITLALSSRSDTSTRTILLDAANVQLGLEDFDGFLSTARAIRNLPASQSQYRQMSRNLVCYLLEDRKVDEAKRFAFMFADQGAEEDDWTRAHLALQLLHLPRPLRDSLKSVQLDSISLTRDAFSIAESVRAPEVTTDVQLALIPVHLQRKDSVAAHRALRLADSARRLIQNADLAKSRAAMVAGKAMSLEELDLAERLTGELWNWQYFESLVNVEKTVGTGENPRLRALRKKIFDHYLDQVTHNPDKRVRDHAFSQLRFRLEYAGKKAVADSLQLPVQPKRSSTEENPPEPAYMPLIMRASESMQKRNIVDTERAIRAIADSDHTGFPARLMINMSSQAHPDDAPILKSHGLKMLLGDKTLHSRDKVLSEFASERLRIWGDNEMAIDLVNEIRDVKIARATLADIGQSTVANLDAPKLRKLVDRIRSREVKEQVLFRLMISMLLSTRAPRDQQAWGIALADSIRTPDLRARATYEKARFLWLRGDSASARTLFLQMLDGKIESLNEYDRRSVIPFLVAANAQDDLLLWARSKTDRVSRAWALLKVIHALSVKLPANSNARRFVFSNGPDGCRDEF